jgi:hypothetical protein
VLQVAGGISAGGNISFGGAPNGSVAAGAAAGTGTAAGADPLLLGGGDAGLRTPARGTSAEEFESIAQTVERTVESTVTKILRDAPPKWLQELREMAESNGDNSVALTNIIAHQKSIMARVS